MRQPDSEIAPSSPADCAPIDRHPRFRRLADYLAAKAPPGGLPGRQHLDPTEIPDLLPYLMLIDIQRPDAGAPPRYRVRLAGTAVVTMQGEEITGRFVDEILTTDAGRDIVQAYGDILRDRQPQYRCGIVTLPGRDYLLYERVIFPLARDGHEVDMLLSVFVTVPQHGPAQPGRAAARTAIAR